MYIVSISFFEIFFKAQEIVKEVGRRDTLKGLDLSGRTWIGMGIFQRGYHKEGTEVVEA